MDKCIGNSVADFTSRDKTVTLEKKHEVVKCIKQTKSNTATANKAVTKRGCVGEEKHCAVLELKALYESVCTSKTLVSKTREDLFKSITSSTFETKKESLQTV